MTMPSAESALVGFRMQEWQLGEQSRRIQTCVRRVLNELCAESLLFLKDPKLEVMVLPESWGMGFVWAYFPIHRRRMIVKHTTALGLPPKPETRILLILTAPEFEKNSAEFLEDCLRDALGHVLLYLRSPKANNDCAAAMKEWRGCVRAPNKAPRRRAKAAQGGKQ